MPVRGPRLPVLPGAEGLQLQRHCASEPAAAETAAAARSARPAGAASIGALRGGRFRAVPGHEQRLLRRQPVLHGRHHLPVRGGQLPWLPAPEDAGLHAGLVRVRALVLNVKWLPRSINAGSCFCLRRVYKSQFAVAVGKSVSSRFSFAMLQIGPEA